MSAALVRGCHIYLPGVRTGVYVYASEQRFWYEDKHFWIDSLPTRCVACRQEQRTRLELRKRYDALIASALGACPPEVKKEVVAIINELEAGEDEIPEKMKENRKVLYAQLAKAG
jgi:hypothetical protein